VKITLLLLAGGAVVSAVAHRAFHSSPSDPALHVSSHFSFTVHAAYDAVFPLFGADRERAWSPGWAPQFVYPAPARDSAGMVFTVAHGPTRAVWINTAFDAASGHVQYTYVIPDALATLIDIRIAALDAATTTVSVTYERTALTPELNDHVRTLAEHDSRQGPEWETAIAECLRAGAKPQ
jgi:hypothetical protein